MTPLEVCRQTTNPVKVLRPFGLAFGPRSGALRQNLCRLLMTTKAK
jgi:hypothetical protein